MIGKHSLRSRSRSRSVQPLAARYVYTYTNPTTRHKLYVPMLTTDIVQAHRDIAALPLHVVLRRFKDTRHTLQQQTVNCHRSFPIALTKVMPFYVALRRFALRKPIYVTPVY
jgi:hypothetical protein